jgi:tungstate transport system substrate-binding protein
MPAPTQQRQHQSTGQHAGPGQQRESFLRDRRVGTREQLVGAQARQHQPHREEQEERQADDGAAGHLAGDGLQRVRTTRLVPDEVHEQPAQFVGELGIHLQHVGIAQAKRLQVGRQRADAGRLGAIDKDRDDLCRSRQRGGHLAAHEVAVVEESGPVGTGQALDIGRRGDADVVFVHDRVAEDKFIAEGFAARRYDVMYNDYVIVGPKSDPARIAGLKDAGQALQRIQSAQPPFVSRADKSGTHAAELRLWREAGIEPDRLRGAWYKETGSGMGPALNTAAAMGAYLLADRGTWLSFRNRGDLQVLVEGDKRLFNPYGVMAVDAARHPHVKREAAQRFIDWLISAAGQQAIADFRIGGEPLFFPNAARL